MWAGSGLRSVLMAGLDVGKALMVGWVVLPRVGWLVVLRARIGAEQGTERAALRHSPGNGPSSPQGGLPMPGHA